jgi:hypothetical protein
MATLSSVTPSALTPIPAEETATLVDSPAVDKTSKVASSNPIFTERPPVSIVPKVITGAILSIGVIVGGAALIIACAATALLKILGALLGAYLVIVGLGTYTHIMRTLSEFNATERKRIIIK